MDLCLGFFSIFFLPKSVPPPLFFGGGGGGGYVLLLSGVLLEDSYFVKQKLDAFLGGHLPGDIYLEFPIELLMMMVPGQAASFLSFCSCP